MAKKESTYTESYEELKKILAGLEEGEIDVDDLSSKVKRASELLELCQKKLKSTEVEVKKIVEKLEAQSSEEVGVEEDEESE